MSVNLSGLRELLSKTIDVDEMVYVDRKDLEALVSMAEKVGLSGDVNAMLERFDTVTAGYQGRIQRQAHAIGQLVGRISTVETVLRELMKSDNIDPELIQGFGSLINLLRNGSKEKADA